MNKRNPYVNFFIRSFSNGQENQGEYTFPGYRIKSKFVPFLEFDDEEENDEGYSQQGAGYLFWYDSYHVIMRPHPCDKNKVLWAISNKRITSNNYGYYPEKLPFCSKRSCLITHIQKAITHHKRYYRNEDLLLQE